MSEEEKETMDRHTIINTLKACENSIREVRQSLEAELRGEVQGGKIQKGDIKRWLEGEEG
jgi:Trp operon repressor